MDAGEWEALVAAGFGDRLHLILSADWQDEIRATARDAAEAERWRTRLGEEDLARITETKEWLDSHPKRSELYAILRFHERAI